MFNVFYILAFAGAKIMKISDMTFNKIELKLKECNDYALFRSFDVLLPRNSKHQLANNAFTCIPYYPFLMCLFLVTGTGIRLCR